MLPREIDIFIFLEGMCLMKMVEEERSVEGRLRDHM